MKKAKKVYTEIRTVLQEKGFFSANVNSVFLANKYMVVIWGCSREGVSATLYCVTLCYLLL